MGGTAGAIYCNAIAALITLTEFSGSINLLLFNYDAEAWVQLKAACLILKLLTLSDACSDNWWVLSSLILVCRMCIVQLDRLDQKDAAVAKRLLADIFWFDVDDRVRALGSTSSTVRARGKRELIEQFYGLSFAYTEGAAKDDCVLASALWRCASMVYA